MASISLKLYLGLFLWKSFQRLVSWRHETYDIYIYPIYIYSIVGLDPFGNQNSRYTTLIWRCFHPEIKSHIMISRHLILCRSFFYSAWSFLFVFLFVFICLGFVFCRCTFDLRSRCTCIGTFQLWILFKQYIRQA